ncbi:DUF2163 domain-containing protein [Salipiger sp. IMCC34102]|nr:DUF2163 domain-containing protein [Salipiger sp. IMCC34102]
MAEGAAHVCRAWLVVRRDGMAFGFTDHDRTLRFGGWTFRPDSGLTARALSTGTGLDVDNSEALGLLQSDVIAEQDIVAGRFDAAEVTQWLVRWDDVSARQIRFRGTIGEITREAGQFRAELRGLAEGLNRPTGRSYLRQCSAVLGDAACKVNLDAAGLRRTAEVVSQSERRVIELDVGDVAEGFFAQGVLEVLDGPAAGLSGAVKAHTRAGGRHRFVLWESLRAKLRAGDRVRVTAGCDKRAETCRLKFSNMINFQGFPFIPGDDWLVSVPRTEANMDGGSLFR